MNPSVRLESIIAEAYKINQNEKDFSLIFTKDCCGLCAGIFILKNQPLTRELLKKIYDQRYNTDVYNLLVTWEQAALNHILKHDPQFETNILYVDQRLLNAMPDQRC